MTADNSAKGLTAQLEEEWDALEELGASLDDTDWLRSTPCPGWPVAAQFAHIIGTESMLLGRPGPDVDAGEPPHVRNAIGGFNERWVVALAAEPRPAVLARLAEVLAARKQAIEAMGEDEFSAPANTPIGPADYRRFMQIRVFDCWVHEQDVRDALARPGHEGGPVVEQCVDEIVRALGFIVGKKAAAPEGSSVTIELTGPVVRTVHVAVDGRAAVVDRLPGAATATVALGSQLFTRLACGRVDPELKLVEVHFAGDTELGRRVVTSLPFTV